VKLQERAPAKLNLTLEVLGKRPDGYHEIRSILQAIDFCDVLHFDDAAATSVSGDLPGWSAPKSLVIKAIDLLRESTGSNKGVALRLEKRIPLLSGLGGDSSDAAATLRGLNRLWGPGLSPEKLTALAARLGSDVPFFIHGGTALAEGRGDKVTPLLPLTERWLVLVVPDSPGQAGKTGRMYAALRPEHFTDGSITARTVGALGRGEFRQDTLFNTFENIAFNDSKIRVYVEHLMKMGAPHVHLAGSGPALFTMFDNQTQAASLHNSCKQQEMESYLVKTL
jgi:4-diphosphocytidyl-2-C-methyl-D-erythritol kinase